MSEHPVFMSRFEGNVKFVLMMSAFLVLAFLFQTQQAQQYQIFDRQVAVQTKLIASQAAIGKVIGEQCDARNDAAAGTNEVLDSLIAAVKITKSLPDAEKVTRLVRYESAKVDIVACPPPK